MTLLLVHALAVSALAGLSWVVQLVVYPSFRIVGRTPAWVAFHDAHSRGLARAVGLPWAVQGVTLAALLVDRPDGVPLWLVLVSAALGLGTVVVTLALAVPLHRRLAAYDDRLARRLVAVHRLRTLAWSAGVAAAAAMLLVARP